MIPEFVGRLPIVATLDALTPEALHDILTTPKNSLIKQYTKLVELDGVELEFEKEAIDTIVNQAIDRNTGARGLRSIIEDLMRDIMFDIPSNPQIVKCIITKETALNKAEPKLVIDKNKKKEPLKMKQSKLQKKENKTA